MNRRMKAERRPAAVGFAPVCSRIAGMPSIISKEGALRKRERALRRKCGCVSSGRAAVRITADITPASPKHVGTASDLLRCRRWSWRSSLCRRRWSWRRSFYCSGWSCRRRKYCAAKHVRLTLLFGLCPVQRALPLSESLLRLPLFLSSCRVQPRRVGHPGSHLGGKLLYPFSFSLHLCGVGSFALNASKTCLGVCHGLLIFGQDFHCCIQRFHSFIQGVHSFIQRILARVQLGLPLGKLLFSGWILFLAGANHRERDERRKDKNLFHVTGNWALAIRTKKWRTAELVKWNPLANPKPALCFLREFFHCLKTCFNLAKPMLLSVETVKAFATGANAF